MRGARCFVTYIDDKSRWVEVHAIKLKSDCFVVFCLFQKRAETKTGRKVKTLRSDGGGEYFSNEFLDHLYRNGITHQSTISYTPQQNGVAECMNRTLKDLMLAMLLHKGVELEFWADALDTATYIRNRVTTQSLPKYTAPYFHWWGDKLDLFPYSSLWKPLLVQTQRR